MKTRLTIIALLVMSASMACAFGLGVFGVGSGNGKCTDQVPIPYSNYTSFVFGNTTTGQTRWLAGTYTNNGRGYISAVQASMSSATGGFRLYSSTCSNATLYANQSCNYKTEFAPTVAGAASNVVKITTNQFEDLRIPTSGVGIAGETPLIVSDNFNRANDYLGANWGQPAGLTNAWYIIDQEATCGGSDYYGAYYIDDFAADQYAENVIPTGHNGGGPAVRLQTSGESAGGYYVNINLPGGTYTIVKITGSTHAALGSAESFSGSTPTIKITASGNIVSVYVDGILSGTRTDSDYATGNPGMIGTAYQHLDDFVGGNL